MVGMCGFSRKMLPHSNWRAYSKMDVVLGVWKNQTVNNIMKDLSLVEVDGKEDSTVVFDWK